MATNEVVGAHSRFPFELNVLERKCFFAGGNDQPAIICAQSLARSSFPIDNLRAKNLEFELVPRPVCQNCKRPWPRIVSANFSLDHLSWFRPINSSVFATQFWRISSERIILPDARRIFLRKQLQSLEQHLRRDLRQPIVQQATRVRRQDVDLVLQ